MSEWQEYKFSDLLVDESISYGIVQPGFHTEINSVPIVRVNNIKNGKIKTDEVLKVASEVEEKYLRTRLAGGELLITVVGSIGECAIVPAALKGWNVARAVSVARIKDDFDKHFIKYCFKSEDLIFQMYGNTNDTVQPTLNLSSLKELIFTLPKFEEQKAIASVLSSLDDKIDLLHRQNTTLERMAETLFRQWFVVEAQEDWVEVTIAHLIDFNHPRKLSKNQITTYLDMAGLDTSNFNPTGWYGRAFSSGTKFINNDTLLARITPCLENGKTAYVSFLSENEVGWGSTEFIVMRPKLGIHPFFAYVLARYQDFRDYAEGCMEGSSGRQRVNTDHLKQYKLRMPSKEVIQRFNEVVGAITPKLELNAKQIQTLEKLRDNLLPKLMSGEIRMQNG